MTRENAEALVGICPEPGCGALIAASVVEPKMVKDNAKFAADMIRRGYRLETWTCEAVRAAKWDCEHAKARRAKKQSRQPELAL